MLNGVFSVWYLEADIARAAGVKPQTIQVYRKRGQFPDPDARSISGRPLWKESTIKAWLKARKSI